MPGFSRVSQHQWHTAKSTRRMGREQQLPLVTGTMSLALEFNASEDLFVNALTQVLCEMNCLVWPCLRYHLTCQHALMAVMQATRPLPCPFNSLPLEPHVPPPTCYMGSACSIRQII